MTDSKYMGLVKNVYVVGSCKNAIYQSQILGSVFTVGKNQTFQEKR